MPSRTVVRNPRLWTIFKFIGLSFLFNGWTALGLRLFRRYAGVDKRVGILVYHVWFSLVKNDLEMDRTSYADHFTRGPFGLRGEA